MQLDEQSGIWLSVRGFGKRTIASEFPGEKMKESQMRHFRALCVHFYDSFRERHRPKFISSPAIAWWGVVRILKTAQ